MRPPVDLLPKINSATKYPSIPTYHAIGERGLLQPEFIPIPAGSLATEKVHGTNARVVLLPEPWQGFLVGSREDLLFYSEDLLHNPAQGIVDGLRPLFPLFGRYASAKAIRTFYFEVYGHKVTDGAKWYTGTQAVGFRLFDVAISEDYESLLPLSPDKIAAWRDGGGQRFLDEQTLVGTAEQLKLPTVPRIPIGTVPTDLGETLAFLQRTIPETKCRLDANGNGRAEGLVIRTPDRSTIVKLRFEDYERTLKKRSSR
jgi:hypothetical protein